MVFGRATHDRREARIHRVGVALMAAAAMAGFKRACAAHECADAIAVVEQEVACRPNDFQLYYVLGLCHGGGCRTHPLTHPEMAVAYLRQALRLAGPSDRPNRAAILDELGNILIRGTSEPRKSALRESLDCHSEAAQLYESIGKPAHAARLHFNVANSFCELSEITGADHWQEAVLHYQRSLESRTRLADPERYAATLENLGTAYRRLPVTDGSNIKNSIKCYRRAIRVYTAAAYPEKHASLHNNLGNAFLSLPGTDAGIVERNARRALRHFDSALRIQSACGGRDYGITQYNRAQAYLRLARSSPAGNLKSAAGCLRKARAAFQSCGEDRYTQLIRAQLERICPP
ncbi:MAG TPA: hypothetical protein VLY04_01825 [Bryobacteraceae bacterium]|nr:hypothetical protein [Bryobacteraceae bacterium]